MIYARRIRKKNRLATNDEHLSVNGIIIVLGSGFFFDSDYFNQTLVNWTRVADSSLTLPVSAGHNPFKLLTKPNPLDLRAIGNIYNARLNKYWQKIGPNSRSTQDNINMPMENYITSKYEWQHLIISRWLCPFYIMSKSITFSSLFYFVIVTTITCGRKRTSMSCRVFF